LAKMSKKGVGEELQGEETGKKRRRGTEKKLF